MEEIGVSVPAAGGIFQCCQKYEITISANATPLENRFVFSCSWCRNVPRCARVVAPFFASVALLLWDTGNAEKSELSLKIGLIIQFDMILEFESYPRIIFRGYR